MIWDVALVGRLQPPRRGGLKASEIVTGGGN